MQHHNRLEKKAMEAELTWIHYDATSGHLMNHKGQTAERKEVRWSAHNFHTIMNVCMREVENNLQLHLRRNVCLYGCVCESYFTACIYMYVFIVFSLYV